MPYIQRTFPETSLFPSDVSASAHNALVLCMPKLGRFALFQSASMIRSDFRIASEFVEENCHKRALECLGRWIDMRVVNRDFLTEIKRVSGRLLLLHKY